MTSSKSSKNTHAGFGYRGLQKENSKLREKLATKDRQWLKTNNYRNTGWINIIALFDKINDLLEVDELADLSLEELFLEVDRIGNKYQEPEEIQAFDRAMAVEAEAISEIIDRIFPDTEPESIDFRDLHPVTKKRTSSQRKTYRTVKV